MATFLVDYENVHANGLTGISKLKDDDLVIVFYTKDVDQITFDLHNKINESKAKVQTIKVENGRKNALDFQLTSYLGFLISKDNSITYYIVSNDQGYRVLTSFWSENSFLINTKVSLVSDLTLRAEKEIQMQFKQKLMTVLKETPYTDKVDEIMLIIEKYKTKQGINNALVKSFESKIAGVIYPKIKPLLTNKNK